MDYWASGYSTDHDVAERICEGVDVNLYYDPSSGGNPGHPLLILGGTVLCADHANLMTGLLRSVGIDASTTYVYGGESGHAHFFSTPQAGSIRVDADAHDNETSGDPYFTYHAVTAATGVYWDPSYGISHSSGVPILCYAAHPPATMRYESSLFSDYEWVSGGCQSTSCALGNTFRPVFMNAPTAWSGWRLASSAGYVRLGRD